jgi:hypothetical protein
MSFGERDAWQVSALFLEFFYEGRVYFIRRYAVFFALLAASVSFS